MNPAARRLKTLARPIVNLWHYLWASPCSAVGLIFAVIALPLGGRVAFRAGVAEVALPRSLRGALGPFGAITFGHVVLGRSEQILAQTRPHERVHVKQYESWGPFFFIAYPASSLFQLLRGRSPYWFNYFEVEARRQCARASAVASDSSAATDPANRGRST